MKDLQSGIYAIELYPEGLIYIGSTTNLRLRRNNHFSCIRHNNRAKGCEAIIDAVQRGNNYNFIVLENVEIEKLEIREQHWIDYFKNENRLKVINMFDAKRENSNVSDDFRITMTKIRTGNNSKYNIYVFNLDGTFNNAYISNRVASKALNISKTMIGYISTRNYGYTHQYKNYIIINYGVLNKLDELLETHQELRAISSEAREKCKSI